MSILLKLGPGHSSVSGYICLLHWYFLVHKAAPKNADSWAQHKDLSLYSVHSMAVNTVNIKKHYLQNFSKCDPKTKSIRITCELPRTVYSGALLHPALPDQKFW